MAKVWSQELSCVGITAYGQCYEPDLILHEAAEVLSISTRVDLFIMSVSVPQRKT